jgi:hypothetical protein
MLGKHSTTKLHPQPYLRQSVTKLPVWPHPPASPSQGLGLQVCTIMPGFSICGVIPFRALNITQTMTKEATSNGWPNGIEHPDAQNCWAEPRG